MTTKPPAPIAEYPSDSLEKLAYSIVSDILTQEPNDRNRLGYHIWAWLKERRGSLEQAVKTSGARTYIPMEQVYEIVKARLEEKGISDS